MKNCPRTTSGVHIWDYKLAFGIPATLEADAALVNEDGYTEIPVHRRCYACQVIDILPKNWESKKGRL